MFEFVRRAQNAGDQGRRSMQTPRETRGEVRTLEERLGGNAAPQHAGAAQGFALDDGTGETELRATDRAHVTGGTAAKNDDVESSHGESEGGAGRRA